MQRLAGLIPRTELPPGVDLDREQVVACYRARTGSSVTNREWAWYEVLQLRCPRIIARTRRSSPERVAAPVGSAC